MRCGPLPPLAIPATLHDALLARLDRLSAAKAVAQLGPRSGARLPMRWCRPSRPGRRDPPGALVQLVTAEVVVQRGSRPRRPTPSSTP